MIYSLEEAKRQHYCRLIAKSDGTDTNSSLSCLQTQKVRNPDEIADAFNTLFF
jgi:hypothetical protein